MKTSIDVTKLRRDEYDAITFVDEDGQTFRLITNFSDDKLFHYVQAIQRYQERKGTAKLQITQQAPYWHQYHKRWAVLNDCYALWCQIPPKHIDLTDFWDIYKELEVNSYGQTRRAG